MVTEAINNQPTPKISVERVSFAYGDKTALNDITLAVPPHSITVLLGPAGGGRTTLLRLINRLNDLVEGAPCRGEF
jgi:phosphate transport system ATP-binding protein